MNAVELLTRLVGEGPRHDGSALLEDEGLDLADALGFDTPARTVVRAVGEVDEAALAALEGERVVVKLLCADVLHRSGVGAVRVVEPRAAAVAEVIGELDARFGGPGVRYMIQRFVADVSRGELLLGLRCTAVWGPVVVLGPGGAAAEDQADALREAQGPIVRNSAEGPWGERAFLRRVLDGTDDPGGARQLLQRHMARLLEFGAQAAQSGLVDFELNPICFSNGAWIALDALGRLEAPDDEARGDGADAPRSPAGADVGPARVEAMLRPRTIGVVGASAKGRNPGRIILQNVIGAGFDPSAVQVVKADLDQLEGCRCVPTVAALEPVDLLAIAVAAAAAADVLDEVIAADAARAVILVPGGMDVGEPGHRPIDRVEQALQAARRDPARRPPIVVGPNSLGIRSAPGRFDTLFLPRDRVRFPGGTPAPVALVSQSGAFALTRLAALPHLAPRYVITLGNQVDVTLGRVAEALAADDQVRASAWYVEGFAPGDGTRWLEALRGMAAEGRPSVVYAAGRTTAGRRAAASHTASVAGDPRILRELSRGAGVAVVDTLHAFEDTLALLAAWSDRERPGRRMGVMSNAGFETVAAADGAGALEMAALAPHTRARLSEVLAAAGVGGFVPVTHPFDVTPMLADAPFVDAFAAILADPDVDVGVVGCVPLTPALDTPLDGSGRMGPGGEGDDVTARLIALWRETTKPWLVVLDAGPGHEWMRTRLRAAGVPVLAGMDRVGPASRAVLGPAALGM